MDLFLKWYLIGCAISLVIQLIAMLSSHVVKVQNVLGYILNTALSWGCLATWLLTTIVSLLNKFHWNKILWTSKEYKEMQEKAAKHNNLPNSKLGKKK